MKTIYQRLQDLIEEIKQQPESHREAKEPGKQENQIIFGVIFLEGNPAISIYEGDDAKEYQDALMGLDHTERFDRAVSRYKCYKL